MKKINLSIGDFALPSPRRGSIEALSGFGESMSLGQEIHKLVQAERALARQDYRAEVPISHEFESGAYRFCIGGRIDGWYETSPVTIEEIKSSYSAVELREKLLASEGEHPYCLQLCTYGYFHWLRTQELPKLVFHLVSTRNGETETFAYPLDIPAYEAWLQRRLAELAEEAALAEKRTKRRQKAIRDFPFPFEKPRRGQMEFIATIEAGIAERRPMLLQAPTGLGKTIGVLYPVLKDALGRGQRVIYVTPKNSQHAVAEDAITRIQEQGAELKSLTITAKSKICFKNEPLCNPDYCEFAKDHYTKVAEHKLGEKLAKKKKLTAKTFERMGREYEVCPFEIQFAAAQEADAVICDYNYVFAPRAATGRIAANGLGQGGKPNLVIDEAHNLPARAMAYYSPSLSSDMLLKMRAELQALPAWLRDDAKDIVDACIGVILHSGGNAQAPTKISIGAESFAEQESALRGLLSRYLDSKIEVKPGDVVLRLVFYWSEFTAALESVAGNAREEFFISYQPSAAGGTVKITCCDAAEMLRDSYDEFEQVVAFSATLKPFDFYSKLSGLAEKNTKTAEFASPFPPEHRKLLIIPQISSKFSDRNRSSPRVAEAIARISALKLGNYFVFFPSFDFLEQVFAQMESPPGFELIKQTRGMGRDDIAALLMRMTSAGKPVIVFAAQGGVFSEGIDYPGEMLIGAFVIGPPLPHFDLEHEEMRKYYEKKYGAGFDYTYIYPAMAKAVQAAGRVIRSETDRGLIVLMDSRFIQPGYMKSMPEDWLSKDMQSPLVSQNILSDISAFWDQQAETSRETN